MRLIARTDGFSLLEVLVAMVITGLVVTSVASVTDVVRRFQPALSRVREQNEQLEATSRIVGQIVRRAYPDLNTEFGTLVGSETALTLVSGGPELSHVWSPGSRETLGAQ